MILLEKVQEEEEYIDYIYIVIIDFKCRHCLYVRMLCMVISCVTIGQAPGSSQGHCY